MIVYIYQLVHLDNIYSWSYMLYKNWGSREFSRFSQRNVKLTLPRWKQGNYLVIPIYGQDDFDLGTGMAGDNDSMGGLSREPRGNDPRAKGKTHRRHGRLSCWWQRGQRGLRSHRFIKHCCRSLVSIVPAASYEAVFGSQWKRFFWRMRFMTHVFGCHLVEWLWAKIVGRFHSLFVKIQASQVCC